MNANEQYEKLRGRKPTKAVQYYDDGSGARMKLVYDSDEQDYTLVLPGGSTYTRLTDEDLGVLIDLIHVVRSARSAGRRASDEGS